MPTLWEVILEVLMHSIQSGRVKTEGRDFMMKVVSEDGNVEYNEMSTRIPQATTLVVSRTPVEGGGMGVLQMMKDGVRPDGPQGGERDAGPYGSQGGGEVDIAEAEEREQVRAGGAKRRLLISILF